MLLRNRGGNGAENQQFLYSNGVWTDLGTLGGFDSWANDINSSGQIVGVSQRDPLDGFSYRAFRYDNGVMTALGTLGGLQSEAWAINDAGQVVGQADIPEGLCCGIYAHAFLYSDGVMTDLGTLGGEYSGARDINNLGQIVGSSLSVPPNVNRWYRAFLYENGVMTDIGDLGGGSALALAINDLGQIVGDSRTAEGEWHAFLYSGGIMTDLGTLGGVESRAWDINESGQVVGESRTADGDWHAFLYNAGDTCGNLGSHANNPYWNSYDNLICSYAEQYSLAPQILKAVIAHESQGITSQNKGGGIVPPTRAYLYEPLTDKSIQAQLSTWNDVLLPTNGPAAGLTPYTVTIPYGTTAGQMCAATSDTQRFSNCSNILGILDQYAFVAQYRIASSYGLGQILYRWHYDRLKREKPNATPEDLYDAELSIKLAAQYLAAQKRTCSPSLSANDLVFDHWATTISAYNTGNCATRNEAYVKAVENWFYIAMGELSYTPRTYGTKGSVRAVPNVTSCSNIESLVEDLKGTGTPQLIATSACEIDDGIFTGTVQIYSDTMGDVLEWEGPAVDTVGHASLAVLPNAATGRVALQVIWGAGAHGTVSQFVEWDGGQFRSLPALDEAGVPLPLGFFGDGSPAVLLPSGNVQLGIRDPSTPLDAVEVELFEFTGDGYQLKNPTETTTTLGTTTVTTTSTTLLATTTTEPLTTTTKQNSTLCGDATGNGELTATDALHVLQSSIGSQSCTLSACDANGDGSVTATDALVILKAVVGHPVELLCPS